MSKQSEAKLNQNYRLTPNTCGNCTYYKRDAVEKRYEGWSGPIVWVEEKNKRCGVGGFAVNKTATCDRYDLRKEDRV